jgi:sarcosine oxidase subunit beta
VAGSRKVVIVGAGVAGLSTAWHAARLGVGEVVVVEKLTPATGSSGASVGDISTLYETVSDIRIRARAMETFAEMEAEIGLHWIGALRGVDDPEGAVRIRESIAIHNELGLAAEEVDALRMVELCPDLATDDLLTAIYSRRAGHVDGHLLCEAYRHRAEALGASVLVGVEVYGRREDRDGRIVLATSQDDMVCDAIVNAAGAWAGPLGEKLAAPTEVIPQRHQVCVVELEAPLPYVMLQFLDSFGYTDSGDGLYFRYESPTQLVAGIHRSYEDDAESVDPDDFQHGVDGAYVDRVVVALDRRLPGLSERMSVQPGWAGLYPLTRDSRPDVGPHPADERVIAAYGLGGAGIQISPVVGQLAAEWLSGEVPTAIPDPEGLLPSRHADSP